MKLIIDISGGIGRQICCLPAIEHLAKQGRTIEVITPWPGIFKNNPNVNAVHDSWHDPGTASPYFSLWKSVIKNGEYVNPEPYHKVEYYTNKWHLIEAFSYLLTGEPIVGRPNLYLTGADKFFGQNIIDKTKEKYGCKHVVVFQPFGASSASVGNEIEDSTCRSLSMKVARDILDKLPEDTMAYYIGNFKFDHPKISMVHEKTLSVRDMFSIVYAADMIVSIDSSIPHIAHALNKTGVVMWGATSSKNLGYDGFINVNREGYPKEYAPYRFDFDGLVNKGAMDFTKKEVKYIVEAIEKKLKET